RLVASLALGRSASVLGLLSSAERARCCPNCLKCLQFALHIFGIASSRYNLLHNPVTAGLQYHCRSDQLSRSPKYVTIAFSPDGMPALVLNADYRPLSYYPLSLWSW